MQRGRPKKTQTGTSKTPAPTEPDAAEIARREQLIHEDKAALSFARKLGLLPPWEKDAREEFEVKYNAGTATDEDYARYDFALRIQNDAVLRHQEIRDTGRVPISPYYDSRLREWRAKLYNPNP